MDPLGTRPAVAGLDPQLILPERRRRPRYKTHTPAYARLNSDSGNVTLDLSAILDINENGISVQTAPPLEPNRHINLCIDLSETNTKIQTSGFVVWSDRSGRAGIRLPSLPDEYRQQLREWLFLNALAACANESVVPQQDRGEEKRASSSSSAASPAVAEAIAEEIVSPAARDHTTILNALAAVQKEVESVGPNLNVALQLLAQRALAFTRSSGAAIAMYPAETGPSTDQGAYMVCRARAGSDAPPIGTQLQVGTGFSGECVRSGRLLRCDDSENDPFADRESCRLLGIRSILAVPIRYGDEVVGLLEVFSPSPNTFSNGDSEILQRLAEAAVGALKRRTGIQETSSPPLPSEDLFSPASHEELSTAIVTPGRFSGFPVHRAHLVFLLTVAALIALVLGFLVAPWVDSKWQRTTSPQQAEQQPTASTLALRTVAGAATVDDLRALAEQGDSTAQFALGAHYATGEDVTQDYNQAFRWFSKSAEQGNVAAQSALGAYYWVGRGVSRDLEKAYFWSILARASGDETSKYRVAVLTSRMTRPQILAIQQQAESWIRQHQLAANPSPAAQ